jgi:hypothetical protein
MIAQGRHKAEAEGAIVKSLARAAPQLQPSCSCPRWIGVGRKIRHAYDDAERAHA